MKRLLVVLVSLLLVVLFTNVALAVQQTVTADLIGLTSGTINAQYEKPLGNKDSLLVSGLISSGAFGVGGGYRKYLGDEKFEGLFAQGTGNLVFGKGATGVWLQVWPGINCSLAKALQLKLLSVEVRDGRRRRNWYWWFWFRVHRSVGLYLVTSRSRINKAACYRTGSLVFISFGGKLPTLRW